jgi:hypothetical protein
MFDTRYDSIGAQYAPEVVNRVVEAGPHRQGAHAPLRKVSPQVQAHCTGQPVPTGSQRERNPRHTR